MNAKRGWRAARLLKQVALGTIRSAGRPKVFCVGRNKTGTSSLAAALAELGFAVGIQSLAERLLQDWARRDFRRLFLYCRTAQAFQDVPFSLPFTFQALDQRFPGSKFILTVRHSSAEWYDSLTRFHAALFGRGNVPGTDDLRSARYVRPGYPLECNRLLYDTPESDPYHRETLMASYEAHNRAVIEYFRHRPGDLLVLNVAEPDAYSNLCAFLGRPRTDRPFPWENKTKDVEKQRAAPSRENGCA